MATATIIDFTVVPAGTFQDPNATSGVITYQLDDNTVHICKVGSGEPTPEQADEAVLNDLKLKARYVGRIIRH